MADEEEEVAGEAETQKDPEDQEEEVPVVTAEEEPNNYEEPAPWETGDDDATTPEQAYETEQESAEKKESKGADDHNEPLFIKTNVQRERAGTIYGPSGEAEEEVEEALREEEEGEEEEGEEEEAVSEEGEEKKPKKRVSLKAEDDVFPEVESTASPLGSAGGDDEEELKAAKRIVSDFTLDLFEEEVKEESTVSEESVPTPLARFPYYSMFLEAMTDYGAVKRLNNFLHKKMGDYFKKRKMEHVLREADHAEEAYAKYGKKLDNFHMLIEVDGKQRDEISKELREMKAIRDKQFEEADKNFRDMIAREQETGTGLISTKTGKEIPEKFLEKMISNQRNKAQELAQLRLAHIKIRNAVAEKHAAIRSLDRIGDNYTLMEFEQLKIENQGHMDKIEERDEELSRLRRKCSGAIQCLAHVREKCSAVEINIRLMKETLEDKEMEKTIVREEMNRHKQERDYFRHEAQRLKEENGLLTKDKLLIDMEDSMNEIKEMENIIKTMQTRCDKRKTKLDNIKLNYEKEKRKRKYKDQLEQMAETKNLHADEAKVYKRRPTLIFPRFENLV